MKAIGEKTKLNPDQRMQKIFSHAENLSQEITKC